MAKMNPEIKKRWLIALRSGKYKQGKNSLRAGNQFCCLGVLCDLAGKAGVGEWEQGQHAYGFDGQVNYLPHSVREWANISNDPYAGDEFLSILNDDGYSFSQIADLIEGNL